MAGRFGYDAAPPSQSKRMPNRPRRSSRQVTLVLLATLAACSQEDRTLRRDVYASKDDCVADWGDEVKCEQTYYNTGHAMAGHTYWYGPAYRSGLFGSDRAGNPSGHCRCRAAGQSRARYEPRQPRRLRRERSGARLRRRLMERLDVAPRPRWREDCEAVGFTFHSLEGVYWDESHCYRFTADEIDVLEAATKELHALSLRAVEAVIAGDRLSELAIPPAFVDYIKTSWKTREPSLLGRFDLAFDGVHPPKLLEYNADTPTALLEASVVQWQWLQDTVRTRTPAADQFNSLHEKLIAAWRVIGLTVSGEHADSFRLRQG